jgi:hypothetical protein
MTTAGDRVQQCEEYIHRPRTPYAARKARYDAAADRLFAARISNADILISQDTLRSWGPRHAAHLLRQVPGRHHGAVDP